MKSYLYIILLSLTYVSCTEPIDLELNTNDNVRLVVDAQLTTETKAHLVDLSLTTDYFKEGTPDRATNAIVTITNGSVVEELKELEPGKYFTSSDYTGVENENYTLEIDYDGKTYSSNSTIEPVATLDSINYVSYEPFDDEDTDNYSVVAYFQEPSELGNYYLFKMRINGEYWTGGIEDWFFTDDSTVNGSYIGDAEFFSFYAEPGDTISFEQFSISKETYENLNAILLETVWRGGLFDGAPANVPSNINNGAIGAFITADLESKDIVIE